MPSNGTSEKGVEALRQEIEGAIGETVDRLRKIEATAQQRLRQARTEQQHLHSFIEELHYRLETIASSPEPPVMITGPLTANQLNAMQEQEQTLQNHRTSLEWVTSGLEQVSSRLSWLIHQIEGACEWVLSPVDSGDGDTEGDAARTAQSTPNEQVMWAQIIMGQEAERARLAREIHDGPAQVLANTVMRLQFVEQLYTRQPGEVEGEFARLRAALQASLNDVRRFMFNLRPQSLADAGLLPTLKQYAADYQEQFDVPVELNLPENLLLSANQELVVFRIVQEALQNIHKHAEATRIEINLQRRPNGPLVVTIADDGRGFNPRSVRQSRPMSSGLVSMRERAATVGATLKIDSKIGTGTTITLTMPMPKDEI
ncbi:MAG TPA: sensor histidine kinase [Chloroflexia bacterium]|nr:sensor histidine kinase [Chloroflexia bacterium]